jgi:hypothetical protein
MSDLCWWDDNLWQGIGPRWIGGVPVRLAVRGCRKVSAEEIYSWNFQEIPEDCHLDMEFRLVYQGPLVSASNSSPKPKAQHDIRLQLHKQLLQYWESHPFLREFFRSLPEIDEDTQKYISHVQQIANHFARGPHKFVPLVRPDREYYCALDILFLRRELPGQVVSGGDLDNRLKTLLDALRVPDGTSGLPTEPSPEPIFCLLQDDRLVTSLKVTTDRLLMPLMEGDHINDVVLVIHVHIYRGIKMADMTHLSGLPGQA